MLLNTVDILPKKFAKIMVVAVRDVLYSCFGELIRSHLAVAIAAFKSIGKSAYKQNTFITQLSPHCADNFDIA